MSDVDIAVQPFRNGRTLSVRNNGVEMWGSQRPLGAALGCLAEVLGGALEVVQAATTPLEARRNRDAEVTLFGRVWAGWQRPFGVAAISVALLGHGIFKAAIGIIGLVPAVLTASTQAAVRPLSERLRIRMGRPAHDVAFASGLAEAATTSGPDIEAPAPSQPRLERSSVAAQQRQARLVELSGRQRSINGTSEQRGL